MTEQFLAPVKVRNTEKQIFFLKNEVTVAEVLGSAR